MFKKTFKKMFVVVYTAICRDCLQSLFPMVLFLKNIHRGLFPKRKLFMSSSFVEALRQTLPPTFSRSVAADALKGVFSAGRLATLDSKGEGPGGVRIGRVVAYERESFLRWLESRMDTPAMGKRLGGCVVRKAGC